MSYSLFNDAINSPYYKASTDIIGRLLSSEMGRMWKEKVVA